MIKVQITGVAPEKATEGSAGYDVKASGFTCVDTTKHVDIRPVFSQEYLDQCEKIPTAQCHTLTDNEDGYKAFILSPFNVFFIKNKVILKPFARAMINTGVFLAIPEGYECQVRSRSGLSAKGLIVAQGVGTIDSDYRGEVQVCINNISSAIQVISLEDRIAQLIFTKVETCHFDLVDKLSDTNRGAGGFGSTGK